MSEYGNIRFRDLAALAKQHGFWKKGKHGFHEIFTNGSKIVVLPNHKGKTIGKGLAIKIINQITQP